MIAGGADFGAAWRSGQMGVDFVMTETDRILQRAQAGKALSAEPVAQVFVLTGGVRATPLMKCSQRSPALLPISAEQTVLDHWIGQLQAGFGAAGDVPPVAVVGPWPGQAEYAGMDVEFLADPAEYRGTAGLLHDLTGDLDEDQVVLVVNGRQILTEGLDTIMDQMVTAGGDLVTASVSDGTPTLLLLARAGVFRSVSPVGYVDLKEQALPRIASNCDVRVVNWDRPIGLNLRTRGDYVSSLRALHRGRTDDDPYREDWRPCFGIVEAGAEVAEGVRLHDSVVLSGGTVGEAATLIRSVVGRGGRVEAGQTLTDVVVGPRGVMRGAVT
jgi:NDP-sugar pyrophosphorylase family protein